MHGNTGKPKIRAGSEQAVERMDWIREARKNGFRWRWIARTLNLTEARVRQIALSMGLPMRQPGGRYAAHR